jgi:dTDP-4-dehydrorhamnose reductase
MRAVIIGAHGQLGQELCRLWPGSVVPLSRQQCDVSAPWSVLRQTLQGYAADVCINCAAYNFVDQAERDPAAAFATNAWGVHNLALACHSLALSLVHVSSDYVFGLDPHNQPLTEDTPPGPMNIYGLSKLTGEYLARQALGERVLIVRTCGLYSRWGSGGKGRNFVETMLRMAQQGQPLRVVADQRCTPSYARDVASAIIQLIARQAHGVYHVVNSGECSWYEFAREIFRLVGLTPPLQPIGSADYPAIARRPTYSVLSTAKMQNFGLPPLRPWPLALAAYLQERASDTSTPSPTDH